MSVRSALLRLRFVWRASGAALILPLLLGSWWASASHAEEIRTTVRFDRSDLRIEETYGSTTVSMRGLPSIGGQGAAALPVALETFYVPEGFRVREMRVFPRMETTIASGARLPVREARRPEADLENESVGSVTRPFPEALIDEAAGVLPAEPSFELEAPGTFAGAQLHSVALFPVRYREASGELTFIDQFDVELVLEPARSPAGLARERISENGARAIREALAAFVANPNDLPAVELRSPDEGAPFEPLDLPSVDGSAVDQVIVTSSSLAAAFQNLADWKTKKGIPTVIRTIDWIDANYPAGHDTPERIRMFLQDAYSKWGTYLVFMGGDYPQVPARMAWNRFFYNGREIPTDQYFACLEGDWNADGDHLIGEGQSAAGTGDLADLYPDVFLGRAPVETIAEVTNFTAKSLQYQKTPPAGGYVEEHALFSEVLFPEGWHYGDPPESIQLDGKQLTEDLDAIVDPTWVRHTSHQSENTYSRGRALSELNTGRHLISMMNHGDAFKFSVGNGFNPFIRVEDINSLTNGNRLIGLVATACNPNQFDLESCGEAFINCVGGGSIFVIGPTRVDFPLSAASFHESMFELIFDHDLTMLGAFTQISRVPFVPLSLTDSTPDRWTMMSKMLLGDPDIRFWTKQPQSLIASHAASVALGTTSITVTVTTATAVPIPNADVCVSKADGTYSRSRTNSTGVATLAISSSATGAANVVVTRQNYRPYEGTFNITAAPAAHLAVTGSTIDDDAAAPSIGNGDATVDAGERIELDLSVRNGGVSTANTAGITASVETGSSVTFDLLYNGLANPSKVFVGPNGVNPATVPFTLNFASPSIQYTGTPPRTFAGDGTTGDDGIFIWQDRNGWHVWYTSGTDPLAVTGTITTNGRIRGTERLDLESTDTLSLNGPATILTVSGATSTTDLVDQFDFALADNTVLTMVNSAAVLGNITAGATTVGTVVFDVANTARSEQIAYVDLSLTAAAGGPWSEVVEIVIAAPELEAIVFEVDDSNSPPVSGDNDGVIEVGETVRLTPTVLNRGTGAAQAVNGSATAASGITFLDASDSYGAIPALGLTAGTNGYVFTVNDGSGTNLDLTLTDSVGRTWIKNMDFVAPAMPVNVAFTSTPSTIALTCDANAEPDVAGYNVYRSTTVGGVYSQVNFEVVRIGSRYVDEGLAFGSGFFYKMTAVDDSGNESPQSAALQAWTTQVQVEGWPQYSGADQNASIVMADADYANGSEIYLGDKNRKLYAWDAGGGELNPPFPIETQGEIWSTAAVADLDKDGDQEIMWGSRDSRFYIVNHDGSPAFGESPIFVDVATTGTELRSVVTVADIDQDAELEFLFGSDAGYLFAFNHDGTGVLNPNGVLFQAPGAGSASIWGTIAVGDVADDGQRRIFFSSANDSVYGIRANGTRLPGFPRGGGGDFRGGVSLGDIDADGTMEILAGSLDGKLYAWNHNGTNYGTLGNGAILVTGGEIRNAPALGNLDGDPQLEIVIGSHDGKSYAINHDGSTFRAGQTGGVFQPHTGAGGAGQITGGAIIVDVDNDGSYEIFYGRDETFYGFHSNGATIVGLPIITAGRIFGCPAAGDLDGDGDVDVAFASFDQTVNVLDYSGAANETTLMWPMLGRSQYHTAVYGEATPFQVSVNPPGLVPLELSLAQNRPNPFARGTSIEYVLPNDAQVSLQIFDVNGRLIRTLVNGAGQPGVHRVAWDGRDQHGSILASGVYFYRLENGDKTITRKTVFLR